MSNKIELVIKKPSTGQTPGPNGFSAEFYHLNRSWPPLFKLFQKIKEQGKFSNSFYKASTTLVPKLGKGRTRKKENERPISLMNTDAKIFNKILANEMQKYSKKIIHLLK